MRQLGRVVTGGAGSQTQKAAQGSESDKKKYQSALNQWLLTQLKLGYEKFKLLSECFFKKYFRLSFLYEQEIIYMIHLITKRQALERKPGLSVQSCIQCLTLLCARYPS